MSINQQESVHNPFLAWPYSLDVDALLATGWRPVPFQDFILKIHSRCNLACDYCYMYRSADQSWRTRPKAMPSAVVDQTARRIGEHIAEHGLARVNVILHGGEPLLAGPELITRAVRQIRLAAGDTDVRMQIQTNGVRLTGPFLRLFEQLGVRVGISLDGGREANDRHRRDHRGRSSYDAVNRAVRQLAGPFRHLWSGLLCTIDPRHDPIATYQALLDFDPPAVDFLLPHANWENPPLGGDGDAPYGKWLTAVFDRWYGAPRRETRIRLFEEIINGLLGGTPRTEAVGLEPDRVIVIETDGAIEQTDALKSAFEGASATGLHVTTDSFDDALLSPPIAARQLGSATLGPQCRACRLSRVCGGGMYAHRYRPGTGFANPSVYCPDLYLLIGHIRQRLAADVEALRAGAP